MSLENVKKGSKIKIWQNRNGETELAQNFLEFMTPSIQSRSEEDR